MFDEIDSNKNGCLDRSELQVGAVKSASLLVCPQRSKSWVCLQPASFYAA